ncbi:MAG: hypothetical protein JNK85_15965 [Verrucomicrobiales bacterium]|nr:hypothetical protein [Verrucomicrobiales bacterium]
MYLLSGIAGGVSIVAAVFLLDGLSRFYSIEGPQNGATRYVRLVVPGLISLVSAMASIWFHHQFRSQPNRKEAPLLKRTEGILFLLVGIVLVGGGFLWLTISGGYMGLHLVAFLLGGSFVVAGLRRLREKP